jgi:tetratricopeptide (TPR) repeat protein
VSHLEDPRDLCWRAEALLQMGRASDALELAVRAVSSDPHDAAALITLARCQIQLGQLDEGEATADRAVAVAPDTSWPHLVRAHALALRGDRKGAIASATDAARIDPDSAGVLADLATYLAEDRQQQAAADTIARARALAPDDPTVAVKESYVAIRARRWSIAEQAARRALDVRPDDPDALNNLGVALERQGRRAEALELYASSAREAPSGLGADNARGVAKRIAGLGGLSAIGIGIFVALRQLGTAGFDALPEGAKVPAIILGVAAVASVIVLSERSKSRDHAQLSDHGRRLVDQEKHRQRAEAREDLRKLAPALTWGLVVCGVLAAVCLALAGGDAVPFVVVIGFVAALLGCCLALGRAGDRA